MCIPGFKAIVRIAQDSEVDLDMVELQPLEKKELQKDLAKLNIEVKRGAQVQELITMMKEGEFPKLQASQHQASILEVASRLEKATVTEVLVQESTKQEEKIIGTKSLIKSIQTGKETVEEVIMDVSKEFGPKAAPTQEVAAIGHMLKEGVHCDEVVTMIEAGMLPSLKSPQIQKPLVTMTANKGLSSVVCEVLVEESTKELQKPTPETKSAKMTEYKGILAKAKTNEVTSKFCLRLPPEKYML